ncbi:hypothetical protein CR513_47410, partial [Mucuna pruriens]
MAFVSHFAANRAKRLKVANLFDIKQTKSESLKQYLTHFNSTTIQEKSREQTRLNVKAVKRNEEVESLHEEAMRRVRERELELREQLDALKVMAECSEPLPCMIWGQPFNKQIDGIVIPPQFREFIVDPFDNT